MSTRSEVLLWAQRVVARKGELPHILLELPADAGADQAQDAFYKIARTSHPDLHRQGLTPEELEMVTSAYAAVAGAYQTLRTQTGQTQRIRPLKPNEIPSGRAAPARAQPEAAPSVAATSSATAAASMEPRALTYYRKAEIALRRGDLKGALLQLKLAIATDPNSPFLRTALSEIELELHKGK